MITIPTYELVGLLGDALPFAHPDKDVPALNAVRVEWDGDMLHTIATNVLAAAWSSWHPDDEPDPGQDIQADLLHPIGSDGDDVPWAINLPAADVKDVISGFKLPAKQSACPLTVTYNPNGRLSVARSRETGLVAVTHTIDGRLDTFPDLRDQFNDARDIVDKVDAVAYSGCQLALFGKVRQRAPMRLTFAPEATHVTIGERFRGIVVPAREAAA